MEGKLVKMEKDYSATIDAALPSATQLAKASHVLPLTFQSGKLNQALESLLVLEKQTRVVYLTTLPPGC